MGGSQSKSNSVSKSTSASLHLVSRGLCKSLRSLSKSGNNGELDLAWADRYRSMKVTKLEMLVRPIDQRAGTIQKVEMVRNVLALTALRLYPALVLTGTVEIFIGGILGADGLSEYLNDTMYHHAIYIEVNGGRFRGILDFSEAGLFYELDQKDIDDSLDKYRAGVDSRIVDVPFASDLVWNDIVEAIKEVAHLYYGAMSWNCQDYTAHIICRAQKK